MTAARPMLIVSLPSRSVAHARRELEEARTNGADVAELRLDLWSAAERTRVGELFPSVLPLLATYRSRAEGGEGSDDPAERAGVLAELARQPFRYVDLEIGRDSRSALAGATPPAPAVVLSCHMPRGATQADVERALRTDPSGAWFLKVVVPAPVGDALGHLRSALPPTGAGRVVLHTTGASGPLYRAWGWTLGFPAVYASLPEIPGRSAVEPSQIPVHLLRHYLSGAAPGPLFGLLGHPVAHSRSPGLFGAWMRARGDRGLYMALDIGSETELAYAVPALADAGFRGVNVTRPWKQAALELASRIGPGAGPCGCANVLTFGPGGEIEAENTDLHAVRRRLIELRDASEWDGGALTVVGSGGAARAALAASQSVGASAVVLARDIASAQRIAGEFGATAVRRPPERLPGLLVNTTPVGHPDAGPPGVDFAPWIAPGGLVLDLVYAPELPVLRSISTARGARYEGGWRLLVYQASESYALWWGAAPDEAEVQSALQAVP